MNTLKKIDAKKSEMKGGYLIKYHANGVIWSKGKIKDGQPDGYWEWYRNDGKLKRSGYWENGQPTGEWTTYKNGKPYKVTKMKAKKISVGNNPRRFVISLKKGLCDAFKLPT